MLLVLKHMYCICRTYSTFSCINVFQKTVSTWDNDWFVLFRHLASASSTDGNKAASFLLSSSHFIVASVAFQNNLDIMVLFTSNHKLSEQNSCIKKCDLLIRTISSCSLSTLIVIVVITQLAHHHAQLNKTK